MISSNGLLALPILAALYLSLDSQRARLWLLLAAGTLTLSAEVWLAEPAARLKSSLDLLLVTALLILSWLGSVLLGRVGQHTNRVLAGLIVLQALPLLSYKSLMAGAATWLLPGLDGGLFQSLTPPLGLSVMTFQAISYSVDSHRKQVPTASFLHFGVYMSFFRTWPQAPFCGRLTLLGS